MCVFLKRSGVDVQYFFPSIIIVLDFHTKLTCCMIPFGIIENPLSQMLFLSVDPRKFCMMVMDA